jgi:hypothetical protein
MPAAFLMAAAQRKTASARGATEAVLLGVMPGAARQDSLNLKSGRRSSESSGRIYAKASKFAGRRILIDPPPFDPIGRGFFVGVNTAPKTPLPNESQTRPDIRDKLTG